MVQFFLTISISIIATALGLFFYLRPRVAMEIQRKFYLSINWRMEPVNYPKEVRATQIMGLMLIFISITAVIYTIMRL